jgi:rhodanese-related sulfurtransferase
MRIRVFLTVALLLISTVAWAQNINFKNLTAEQVKNLMEQPGKVLVVDARTEAEYRKGHIPTAINIPPPQFSSIEKYLPQDKNSTVIFYCRGYS